MRPGSANIVLKRTSLVAPIRHLADQWREEMSDYHEGSSLAVVGPMAQQLLGKQDKRTQSELLRRQLDDLSAAAAEAEEQLNEFQSEEGMISLKVLVVIDPQDEDNLEAALVIQASAKTSLPSSWTWQLCKNCLGVPGSTWEPRQEAAEAENSTSAQNGSYETIVNNCAVTISSEERAEKETDLAQGEQARGGCCAEDLLRRDYIVSRSQQRARDAAKAISASFETAPWRAACRVIDGGHALGALDAASAALQRAGQKL
eukprot:Skav209843  [mRNA]  locus=scaffold2703:371582:375922:+ [translate_table: standard]